MATRLPTRDVETLDVENDVDDGHGGREIADGCAICAMLIPEDGDNAVRVGRAVEHPPNIHTLTLLCRTCNSL